MKRQKMIRVLVFVVAAGLVATLTASPLAGQVPLAGSNLQTQIDGDEDLSFEEVLLEETGFSVEQWLEPWAATRETHGFETKSIEWLARLADGKTGQEGWYTYGVPLTSLEQRELALREAMADDIAALDERALSIPTFAGISVDVQNGKTRATVRFTKRITRGERTALRAMVSDPSRIEFDYTAEHSLTSLSDMSEELLETMMVGSIPVSTLHIDISRNTVVAGVDPANSAQIARSISEVATDKRIAELVTVEERDSYEPTACFSRFSCGEPLRGGLFAENLDRPSLDAVFDPKGFASCTTGFMINRGGRRAITTAEHCGVPGDRFRLGGRVGPSNGFPFMSYGTTFYNFDGTQPRVSRYDVGAIEVPLRQFSSHVFRTKKSKFVKLDLVHSRNSIIANNTVCVHGIRLGRLCGPVIQGQGINRLSDSGVTHLDMIPFQVFLPGNPDQWGCSRRDNPTATRIIAGNSGGPVTDGTGKIAIGSASLCLVTTKEQVRPGTTKIRLAMTPMEPALDALGATLKTG